MIEKACLHAGENKVNKIFTFFLPYSRKYSYAQMHGEQEERDGFYR
jgi:hypothetical protein